VNRAILWACLAASLCFSAVNSASAQTPLTIKMKDEYDSYETILITGNVGTVSKNSSALLIQIINPKGETYRYDLVDVAADGSYAYKLEIGGRLGIPGEYKAIVSYDQRKTETTFRFNTNVIVDEFWYSHPVIIDGDEHIFTYRPESPLTIHNVSANVENKLLAISVESFGDGFLSVRIPATLMNFSSCDAGSESGHMIIVDGLDMETETSATEHFREFKIPVTKSTEKIEIIGTSMVPEFGSWVLPLMALLIAVTAVMPRIHFGKQ
jgi:hypothetical protein